MNCDQFQKRLERLVETRAELQDPLLEAHALSCAACAERLKEARWLDYVAGLWAAHQASWGPLGVPEQAGARSARAHAQRPAGEAVVPAASGPADERPVRPGGAAVRAARSGRAWAAVASALVAVGLFLCSRPAARWTFGPDAVVGSAVRHATPKQPARPLLLGSTDGQGGFASRSQGRFVRPTESGLAATNGRTSLGQDKWSRQESAGRVSEQLLAGLRSLFGNAEPTGSTATGSTEPTASVEQPDAAGRQPQPEPRRIGVSLSWTLWPSDGSRGSEPDENGSELGLELPRELGRPLTSVRRDLTEALNILAETLPLPPTS